MSTKLGDGQYFGRVLRRRAVAGLILTETHYAPFAHLPRHAHANAYVCLVRRGSFTETYGRRTRTCGPWTLAFHPPEETHDEHFHAGGVLSFNVELPTAWLRRAAPAAELLERSPDFHGGPLAGLADRLYREFRQPDALSALAVEGLTLEILAAAARLDRDDGRALSLWLRQARELLDDRFAEPLSLGEVAAAVGVHPVHLAARFRRHFRASVGEYLRQRRVEAAARLLTATDTPLAEVALAVGFADQSHFSRTFRRHTGLTPSHYRRQGRA